MAPEYSARLSTATAHQADAADFPAPLRAVFENPRDSKLRKRPAAPCLLEKGLPPHLLQSISRRALRQLCGGARGRFHRLPNPSSLRGTPTSNTQWDSPDP